MSEQDTKLQRKRFKCEIPVMFNSVPVLLLLDIPYLHHLHYKGIHTSFVKIFVTPLCILGRYDDLYNFTKEEGMQGRDVEWTNVVHITMCW